MANLRDWVWRPAADVRDAIRRGDGKIRAYAARLRDEFGGPAARREPRTEAEWRELAEAQAQVNAYLLRVLGPKEGERDGKEGATMNWAAVVLRTEGMKALARVLSRHATKEEAEAAAAALPEGQRDHIVLTGEPGEMVAFSPAELDRLMEVFGDRRLGLRRPAKEAALLRHLAAFDPTRHGADGVATEPYSTAPEVKAVGSKKKGAKAPKAEKGPKAEKSPKAGKPAGDGLGRAGTPARFIRELFKAGKDAGEVFEAATKKFPKNPITRGYVTWYRRDMEIKGLLAKAPEKEKTPAKKK